jgi:uncharacterized protein YkwD
MKKILNPRVLAGGLFAALVLAFTPSVAAVSSTTYESDVIRWTNIKRVAAHKPKVAAQSCVDKYAERQAAWMASHRTLKHQSMGTILRGCGLTSVSENIAYGYSSGRGVVTAWMMSSGHRANLLSSKMRLIGVGAVKDSRGTWWVSQVFGRK